jgi:DNA invertase Pin-like site-specific DNA recombinase
MSNKQKRNAAEYLRMSSDLQDFSVSGQRETIRAFARAHGITVVASYEDLGRSGLTIEHRPEMRRLLRDVMSKDCPFSVVLVHDVTRWGRFQDVDASAYHEYHCRLHGVDILYVREPFTNEESSTKSMVKGLKRYMAAEYSRELAAKTKRGQTRVVQRGFQMGSLPCLGFRRVAVSKTGRSRVLGAGDRKGIQTERIRWIPGPAREVEAVRAIFESYANSDISLRDLARRLSHEGLLAADGRPITEKRLGNLLECEAYIGHFVWGRFDNSMRRPPTRRPPNNSDFVRAERVLDAMVSLETWKQVQAKRKSRSRPGYTKHDLLESLSAALKRNPAIGSIDLRGYGCPSEKAYVSAFGSFQEGLRLAGQDCSTARTLRMEQHARTLALSRRLTNDICSLLTSRGVSCTRVQREHVLMLDRRLHLRVQAICRRPHKSEPRWWFSRRDWGSCDFLLLARIEQDGTARDLLLADRLTYLELPGWIGDAAPAGAVRICNAEELVSEVFQLVALTH